MTTWTKEPPKEPGWYWWQMKPREEAEVVYVYGDGSFRAICADEKWSEEDGGLWWPARITPPSEEKP